MPHIGAPQAPVVNIFHEQGPIAGQPCPEPPAPPESSPRETWAGRYEFLLSCLGYCVGLGNVWRFPYLCYRNGGGVFLIPYFIMLFLTGLPLFLMELSLGQYGAAGPITVWKCCPILRGVGVGMLIVSSLVSLYYNVIIAWAFYYLGSSFQSPLPWSCDAPRNAELCQVGVPGLGPGGQMLQGARGGSLGPSFACSRRGGGRWLGWGWGWAGRMMVMVTVMVTLLCCRTHRGAPPTPAPARLSGSKSGGDRSWDGAEPTGSSRWCWRLCERQRGGRGRCGGGEGALQQGDSWCQCCALHPVPLTCVPASPCLSEQVLGVTHSSGLGDPGPVQWPLALCLLAAWVVVFLCMLKGIRSSGKVVYFTATFPYLVILILIIRGATLNGSLNGVRFYLSSDWSKLQSAQVWSDAASQIFYSLGIGFGGLLSMASYNKFDNNVIRDTLVIAIGNCCTSFFTGFAIFSVLGHMALKKGVPVGSVADSGPGLAFVAYPEALSLLPGSPFWSILFFLMLFTLGVDTMFGNIEGITTAILDEFPALREWRRKALFLGALCISFYLLGLLLITQGGIFWFTLIDTYSTGFGLVIITLFMCLGISFCYGINQFCQDIRDMICQCPPWCSHMLGYFRVCWVFFTPCLLLFTLIYTFLEMYGVPLRYGSYTYPAWGTSLGICVGVLTCLQVPLWATVALCRESGTLSDRIQKATQPLNSWRAASGRDVSAEVINVPFTITLTSSDFTAQPDSNT
ncbi:Sodium-dependent proline transporter [Aix galericulata]|nr:Sodium-dependent proline transporter [Aix galericulata]